MKDIKCLAFVVGIFFIGNFAVSMLTFASVYVGLGASVFVLGVFFFIGLFLVKYAFNNQDEDDEDGDDGESSVSLEDIAIPVFNVGYFIRDGKPYCKIHEIRLSSDYFHGKGTVYYCRECDKYFKVKEKN